MQAIDYDELQITKLNVPIFVSIYGVKHLLIPKREKKDCSLIYVIAFEITKKGKPVHFTKGKILHWRGHCIDDFPNDVKKIAWKRAYAICMTELERSANANN